MAHEFDTGPVAEPFASLPETALYWLVQPVGTGWGLPLLPSPGL